MKQLQFPITIKLMYEEEAKEAPYIAYISEFDVSSCGKTEQEAIRHAKEALDILLEEVQKKGQLGAFLLPTTVHCAKFLKNSVGNTAEQKEIIS